MVQVLSVWLRRRITAICALLVFVVGGWAQVHIFLPSVGGPIPRLWWLITICEALVVFLVANPRIPATFLTLAALLFGASHATPTGPIGMLCFLIAAILPGTEVIDVPLLIGLILRWNSNSAGLDFSRSGLSMIDSTWQSLRQVEPVVDYNIKTNTGSSCVFQ